MRLFPAPGAVDVDPNVTLTAPYERDADGAAAEFSALYDDFFCQPVAADLRAENGLLTIAPKMPLALRTHYTARTFACRDPYGVSIFEEFSFMTRDGRWKPVMAIGEGGPGRHALDVDENGRVLAAWSCGDETTVPVARQWSGGDWSRPVLLGPRTKDHVSGLTAITIGAEAYATWGVFPAREDSASSGVFLGSIPPTGVPTAPVMVTEDTWSDHAFLRVGPTGHSLVWSEPKRSGGLWICDPCAFSRATAKRANLNEDGIFQFRAASDGRGQGLLVWGSVKGATFDIHARSFTSGAMGEVHRFGLSLRRPGFREQQVAYEVAMNDRGEGIVVWVTRPADETEGGEIWMNRLSGGKWSTPVLLRRTPEAVAPRAVFPALRSDGTTFLLWQEWGTLREGGDGTTLRLAEADAHGLRCMRVLAESRYSDETLRLYGIAMGRRDDALVYWVRNSSAPIGRDTQDLMVLRFSRSAGWIATPERFQSQLGYAICRVQAVIDPRGVITLVWSESRDRESSLSSVRFE